MIDLSGFKWLRRKPACESKDDDTPTPKSLIGLDVKNSSHSLLDIWPLWCKRIIEYARIEQTDHR